MYSYKNRLSLIDVCCTFTYKPVKLSKFNLMLITVNFNLVRKVKKPEDED